MLAIHSFFKNTTDFRSNIDFVAKQANLSCKFLKKHNFNTILYTDKSCVNNFKHIFYDEIIILDIYSIKPNLPKDFWSASKLISCSFVNEPYIHVDTDLFLIENCLQEILNKDFFVLHQEFWTKYTSDITYLNKIYDFISDDSLYYNNAIFGGQKYDIINKAINYVLDSAINNNDTINEILFSGKSKNNNHHRKSVFVEQYLLNNLIKKELGISKIPMVLKESLDYTTEKATYSLLKKYGIIHLWTMKYRISPNEINYALDMIEKDFL